MPEIMMQAPEGTTHIDLNDQSNSQWIMMGEVLGMFRYWTFDCWSSLKLLDNFPRMNLKAIPQAPTEPEHEYIVEPFVVGNQYFTLAGELVRFIEVKMKGTHYETMMDEHGTHRYTNRYEGQEMGRCTGRDEDYHKNVRPLYRKVVK